MDKVNEKAALFTDTVAALSTPPGKGGVAVIRITGRDAIPVAARVFRPKRGAPLSETPGYTLRFGEILDEGGRLDEGLAAVFRAPRSFTGEDVVELSWPRRRPAHRKGACRRGLPQGKARSRRGVHPPRLSFGKAGAFRRGSRRRPSGRRERRRTAHGGCRGRRERCPARSGSSAGKFPPFLPPLMFAGTIRRRILPTLPPPKCRRRFRSSLQGWRICLPATAGGMR